jgi:hypothetical protein
MQQLPPPTSPISGKGLLGSNTLTSPNTSLGENDPNDGGIVGQPLTTLTTPPYLVEMLEPLHRVDSLDTNQQQQEWQHHQHLY